MSVSMVDTQGRSFENPAYGNTEEPTPTDVMNITSAVNQVSHLMMKRLRSYQPCFMERLNDLPCPPQESAGPPKSPLYVQAADELRQKSLKAASDGKVCFTFFSFISKFSDTCCV